MNRREYVIDVEPYHDRILRVLVKNDTPNPAGLATMLIRRTVPIRNGGLTNVIRYLSDKDLSSDVKWKLLECLNELWSVLQVPSTLTDDVVYQYQSIRGVVLATVSTPMDCLTPTEWLNELIESGYNVDTNTRRIFEQYQVDRYRPERKSPFDDGLDW